MIALVAWGWALIGIVVFLALGLLAALLFGTAGWLAALVRRPAGRRSVYRGVELPDEVPTP